ncbi:hypothetical protein RRG08_017765 [Elysia crispata]|uniref:Uncharacterized protein n=1 Tax=Elysia crispata TaxID=231223 RepID=A0AAE0YWZ3_9GAST|nr:hypothetical protein RRG08_017765 [Elysia crispata]
MPNPIRFQQVPRHHSHLVSIDLTPHKQWHQYCCQCGGQPLSPVTTDKMCPFQAMFDKRRQKIFTQPKAATWCLEPAVSSHFLTLLFEENPSPGRPVTVSGSGTGRNRPGGASHLHGKVTG